MFTLINPKNTIKFMHIAVPAMILASLVVISSIVLLCTKGLNFGLDFTGGTVIEVEYQQDADLNEVRSIIEKAGIASPVVQHFGSSKIVMIRIKPMENVDQKETADQVYKIISKAHKDVKLNRIEFVGPSVGSELVTSGMMAVGLSLLCILAYVGARFEWRMASAAIVALIHDTVITLGFFSLLEYEFDLTVLAAVLTIIGYSLNDTIVVFDRIRENARVARDMDMKEILNVSITETLSRTIITSSTTMFTVLALLFFGGPMIFGFSFAMTIGIIVGTFSSIYVASALALYMGMKRENLIPPPPIKRDEEIIEVLEED